MTTREVSGTDLPFEEAVSAELVPKPELMTWNDWQAWRRGVGLRPTIAADGGRGEGKVEAALWRRVMQVYHGDDWAAQLGVRQSEEDLPEAEDAASALPSVPSGAVAPPAAGAASPAPGYSTPRRVAQPEPVRAGDEGPGSGDSRPGGARSPTPSWASERPGTPKMLRTRMLRSFRPELEPLDVYLIRLDRQAAAAERIGAAMEDELLMVIKAKANLENQMWEAAPNDPA